jgi:hypothetical protein
MRRPAKGPQEYGSPAKRSQQNARRAVALKENLKRRKNQARAKATIRQRTR